MHKVQLIYQWYLVLRHIVKNTDVSFCVEFVLEATTKKSQVKLLLFHRLCETTEDMFDF